ncbi:tail completion protein gp17 [Acinetobacter baumannii]|uniref:tail completion protein gp17 n=1 Tax=Acinetobacter baumannii TaxID=470 RepID=UPI0038915977
MIDVPIFKLARADPAVKALLESDGILRVWKFGSAPDEPQAPYVTWQTISGDSNSNLDSRPVSDNAIIQIDVYATDEDVVDQVAKAIRFAIELDCYVVRYGEADKDPVTGMPHYSFDVSWIVNH